MRAIQEYYNIGFTTLFRLLVFFYRKGHINSDNHLFIGFSSAWYGGNIKGLLDYLLNNSKLLEDNKIHIYFTSPNKEQVEISKKKGINAYWWHDIRAIPIFSKTNLFVTSHGESYLPVTRRSKFSDFLRDFLGEFAIKFKSGKIEYVGGNFSVKRMELWHGIPFKDVYIDKVPIPPDIFCVTSDFMKKSYSKKGYYPKIFRITGYPRNDILFKKINRKKIFTELRIPSDKKIILYAPTWGHYTGMGLFPWSDWKETLALFDNFAHRYRNTHFVIRTHRYWEGKKSTDVNDVLSKYSNISWISMEEYPDTYTLLSVTDVLITDWSSIAFDFMLKRKPIIFIDRPNPYGEFCFTPNERAGAIVYTKDQLMDSLKDALKDSEKFIKKYAPNFDVVLNKAFLYKNGKSSDRCIEELIKLLKI